MILDVQYVFGIIVIANILRLDIFRLFLATNTEFERSVILPSVGLGSLRPHVKDDALRRHSGTLVKRGDDDWRDSIVIAVGFAFDVEEHALLLTVDELLIRLFEG